MDPLDTRFDDEPTEAGPGEISYPGANLKVMRHSLTSYLEKEIVPKVGC